jgi:hypothetical protein
VINCLYFKTGKSPTKGFVELLKYGKLSISFPTRDRMLYLDYPVGWGSLAKVYQKCYGCKTNVIHEQWMARHLSMVYRKLSLNLMKIKFNGDSISKNIWNGKYLRSF